MIGVVGLSHRSAPIEIRERLAFPADVLPRVLTDIVAIPGVAEALLISTCNRVEVVFAPEHPESLDQAARAVVQAMATRAPGIDQHLYVHHHIAAIRHLFQVTSSLDSLVLGEPQILGQVKDALALARRTGTIGSRLERVLNRALRTAKRVRTETAIGGGQVSVPSVAVDLTRQIFGSLRRKVAVLIGSGEMAETVARLLQHDGARILVVGRNEHRVGVVAHSVGGEAREWEQLRAALVEADVVITSTSAPRPIIGNDLVAGLRRERRGRHLFFIDLAVPRDVDPKVELLEWVFNYNIDDFSRVVAESVSAREREAEQARGIVELEVASFSRWAEGEVVTPVLVALRTRVRQQLEAELARSLAGPLKHLEDADRASLGRMVEAVTKKLLHTPTERLRELATDRDRDSLSTEQIVEVLTDLFDLDATISQRSTSLVTSAASSPSHEDAPPRHSSPGETIP